MKMNGRKLELDDIALGRILLADHVKDKPVVVVAVAGAFRKGKSFLLNFLLRYLRNLGRASVDWLGDPETPLRGFDWRNGSERHTVGILVWSEVFLVTTSQGREVAVVLMDTEGTFDCETTTRTYSAIFALATMVSSVLIYNISQNIHGYNLQHLQLFTEYALLAREDTSRHPFQKVMFLVRDWPCPKDASYGADGGQAILQRRLEIKPGQDKELKHLRQRLRSSFSKIDCFLMPYPGTKVATSELFDGCLSDIDEAFKTQLRQLVPLVLAPNNLLVKEVNGREITCRDLMGYFKAYASAFKKDRVPAPLTIYEATLKGSNIAAKDRARDLYTIEMAKVWQKDGSEDREKMKGHHLRLFEEAKRLFEAIPKMGGQEYSRRYMDKLTKEIGEIFDDFSKVLGRKKRIVDSVAFNAAHAVVTTGIGAAAISLAVVELPVVAAVCGAVGALSLTGYVYNTVKTYRRKHKRQQEGSKALLAAADEDSDSSLTEQVSMEHQTAESAQVEPGPVAKPHLATASAASKEEEALEEAGNLSALTKAKWMYNASMEQLCGDALPSLSSQLLESHHYQLRMTAQELFLCTCSAAGVKVLPHFVERLSKEIDELFENFVNQNQVK